MFDAAWLEIPDFALRIAASGCIWNVIVSDVYKRQEHINHANDLGTTKSSLFEDMTNLLTQIAPLTEELEKNTIVLDNSK